MTGAAEALHIAVGAFVSELARAGVRHVCACPGSRSAPLALELARCSDIKLWMHLDERSAAYFALGLARALRAPVAVLATSGTAAANFFPAVVEASLARVPLLVLTADRPHELRDNGAPQSIDQIRLYGEHVRWFFDLPEPEATPEHVRLVRTAAARSVATAHAEPAGPVHLNWPFREPLVPAAHDAESAAAWGARPRGEPYTRVRRGRLTPSADTVRALASELSGTERGVIICGPQDDPDLPPSLASLAARLNWPILADALSGVRRGAHDRSRVIDAYDAFVRDGATVERLEPQTIIRFGALPTSKPLVQYGQRYAAARQIVVDPGGWREPTGLASELLQVDPVALCDALTPSLSTRAFSGWAELWLDINARTRQAVDRHLREMDELFEPKAIARVAAALPQGATLFAGNSMPVRDLDTFLPAGPALRCLSNRGANGIDGVVSSALGASAAGPGPVALVIGDVSFYHDLNGLLAARQHGLDLLVVLLNNDGGGIFSFLPQAAEAQAEFDPLFGTPHGLDFRPFVEGYGGAFTPIASWESFDHAIERALRRGGLNVLEVPTDRARNVVLHRQVWRAVGEALAAAPVC